MEKHLLAHFLNVRAVDDLRSLNFTTAKSPTFVTTMRRRSDIESPVSFLFELNCEQKCRIVNADACGRAENGNR